MLASGLSRGLETTQHVSDKHKAPQTNNKYKWTASYTLGMISQSAGRQGSKQA